MSTDTSTDAKKDEKDEKEKVDSARSSKTKASKASTDSTDSYVLPVVGLRVQSKIVDAGFWGGMVGAAALGIIDPPLALFVGAGVVIARHRTKK
jgi:hypothetical protein